MTASFTALAYAETWKTASLSTCGSDISVSVEEHMNTTMSDTEQSPPARFRWRRIRPLTALAACVGLLLLIACQSGNSAASSPDPYFKGNPKAAVTVVEWGDFQ